MHLPSILVGLLALLLSGGLGILVAFTSFWIFSHSTPKLDEMLELRKNNTSVGVLIAAVLMANALVLKQVLFPVASCFRGVLQGNPDSAGWLQVVGYGLAYFSLAQLASLFAILMGIRLFTFWTRDLDEMEEIRNNNLAVALTLGAVVLVLGMFLAEGIQGLLAALIPSPYVDGIRTMGL